MKHDLKFSRFSNINCKVYKCLKCKEFFYEKFDSSKMKRRRKIALTKNNYDPHYIYKSSFKLVKQNIFGIMCFNSSEGVWMIKNGKTYLTNPFTGKKLYTESCKYSYIDLMMKEIL